MKTKKTKYSFKPNYKKMTPEELEKYYNWVRKSHHVFQDKRKKKEKHKKGREEDYE